MFANDHELFIEFFQTIGRDYVNIQVRQDNYYFFKFRKLYKDGLKGRFYASSSSLAKVELFMIQSWSFVNIRVREILQFTPPDFEPFKPIE